MGADRLRAAAAGVALLASAPTAVPAQEFLLWGVQVEHLELRAGADEDVLAWDGDAFVGDDELKLVFRSEGERGLDDAEFEKLENQLRLQTPVSAFFDAVAGVRLDTPDGGPDRIYGVVGLKGLAPQWFEIDADLYLSDRPAFRVEAEYEALITQRVALVPSIELELPLADDGPLRRGAFAPVLEAGVRLSYDLVDRLVSPYVGVHYERSLGESGDRAERAGDDRDALFLVVGTRILF